MDVTPERPLGWPRVIRRIGLLQLATVGSVLLAGVLFERFSLLLGAVVLVVFFVVAYVKGTDLFLGRGGCSSLLLLMVNMLLVASAAAIGANLFADAVLAADGQTVTAVVRSSWQGSRGPRYYRLRYLDGSPIPGRLAESDPHRRLTIGSHLQVVASRAGIVNPRRPDELDPAAHGIWLAIVLALILASYTLLGVSGERRRRREADQSTLASSQPDH